MAWNSSYKVSRGSSTRRFRQGRSSWDLRTLLTRPGTCGKANSQKDNHLSSFRDFFRNEITVGGPLFANPTLANISPRVGFAWSTAARIALRARVGCTFLLQAKRT
jgi:hypothetical protein